MALACPIVYVRLRWYRVRTSRKRLMIERTASTPGRLIFGWLKTASRHVHVREPLCTSLPGSRLQGCDRRCRAAPSSRPEESGKDYLDLSLLRLDVNTFDRPGGRRLSVEQAATGLRDFIETIQAQISEAWKKQAIQNAKPPKV
jgi:hypothetical protein